MDPPRVGRRFIPLAFGLGVLAVLVAAALTPNAGAVPAQSYCQYNQCIAGTGVPWWALAAVAVIIVAALGAALLMMRRGRRPPSKPVQPYQSPPGGATGGASGPTGPAGPAATPAYVEGPEDVGAVPPPLTTAPVAGAVAGAAAGGAAGAAAATAAKSSGEPDIDSLMAELDKISTEILKRPKTPPGSGGDAGASGGGGSS
jgi:hypothetical protein